ncbi:vWA domain-containing protein [Colwellia piezophila]|uniref:vWA domain-containing protein n=1 Tax=Colwellia piezophila TaxID=211668 RepID=UPI00036BCCB2|nr:VWA domain-containing protein [Colwellia piezophila]
MPNFEYPALLWLLLLLPIFWLISRSNSALSQHQYSDISLLINLPKSYRQKFSKLVASLYLLALAAIIIACAQPFKNTQHYSEQTQGIAIAIVIDVSSSMNFAMKSKGQQKPRMVVAKKALQDFVLGNGNKLSGRRNDLISVITFARYPDTLVPLTSSHSALVDMTNEITTSSRPNEDGTAFGDATALAAAQLHHYENSLGLEDDSIKSKVIILLTDGENNSGTYQPLMAAAMAKKWGVKIYTISIADNESSLFTDSKGTTLALSESMQSTDWTLQAMAESTGGIFQKANDSESLQSVYQAINTLETSSLQRVLFQDHNPLFHLPVIFALLCFFMANVLNATWLRKQT